MEKSISEAIGGKSGNSILPFLWMHGEDEAVLREEVRRIHESGIGAVCVEARPHPDFCGEKWWLDLGIVIDECRAHGMKVWILDDAHFPTGYANGILAKKYPERSKRYFKLHTLVAAGPLPGAQYDTRPLLTMPAAPGMADFLEGALERPVLPQDNFLFAAMACPVDEAGALGAAVLLTENVRDGVLHWDVPAGTWKLFLVEVTRTGGGKTSYLNWIDPVSAACQIEAVYEPHFEHFGDEFGKTIAGFFSDEPEIGNTVGYSFDERVGHKDMPLPYSEALCARLSDLLGADWVTLLPALWRDFADDALSATVRGAYMDAVTTLISENFSDRIGQWCTAHGVEYIGHIIEDNNAHARLGSSMGHYFRALSGQHMAGIDDIGNQVIFGGERTRREGGFGGDGEFYHFALGKLGASLGHIDPKKQGRTMCEIFGAYGWGEGTRLMKWLTDHFLVRGVNVFVPHAFSPMEFPDPDCPPHFYARGNNPMFGGFGVLMGYMNRMCHVLSNGTHRATAAILYHGDSEWRGEAMLLQKPARALMEHQIDFDILPADVWCAENPYDASFDGKTLRVNREQYRCLVVPYAEFLPIAAARFIADATAQGFPVYFVDGAPRGVVGGSEAENAAALEGLSRAKIVALPVLADALLQDGMAEVFAKPAFSALRVYHYEKETHLFMVNNESPDKTFSGTLTLPVSGVPVRYDALDNKLFAVPYTETAAGVSVEITLEPYESALLSLEPALPEAALPAPRALDAGQVLAGPYRISFRETGRSDVFTDEETTDTLQNISLKKPDFAGTIRYELTFTAESGDVLELPEAFEFAEAWLNGEKLGARLCPPYRFPCGGALKKGENALVIEVSNTLDHRIKEAPNPYMAQSLIAPSGLLKPPVLRKFM